MEKIVVNILSKEPHVSQILTGFMLWKKRLGMSGDGVQLLFKDCTAQAELPFHSVMLLAEYHGKKIVYDMLDGYQHPDAIQYHLKHCDFYFKRSFSHEKNLNLNLDGLEKMYPLGFNYHVSCNNHPIDKPAWKETVKKWIGLEYNNYCSTAFNSALFEDKPRYKTGGFTVMFATRLWDEWNEECRYINQMRIDVLRQLRDIPDIQFVGGLTDNALSREKAPDLILPGEMGVRRNYLRQMKAADICIGSMGLFESIGWKTGEYVAGAKAIVNERFHYAVPGDFREHVNYIPFETAEECLVGVERLLKDPDRVYQMKMANYQYYLDHLRPDVLVRNTLDIVDGKQ